MATYAYYFFNLAVGLPVVILSFVTPIKLHPKWRRLLIAFLTVSVPFILWDIWEAHSGHWGFSSRYITSTRLFGLPVEELLFFLTVPLACMYTWVGISKLRLSVESLSDRYVKIFLAVGVFLSIALFLANGNHTYTRAVAVVFLISVVLLLWQGRLIRRRQFWLFQLVLLGLFLVANTFLTALPVIIYSDHAITGLRVGTIPMEDFFFNFALINTWLMVLDNK